MTELFMIQDKSDSKEATWEFLDRRLDNVLSLGKASTMSKNTADAVSMGLGSIFNMAKSFTPAGAPMDDSEILKR